MSVTKHRLTRETIEQMAGKAFPQDLVSEYRELTEGYFNIAYLLRLTDGREVILKVAPPPEAQIMSYEKNIMFSEVDSMRRVAAQTDVPVAAILFYDDSHTLCPSDYFFMEKLPGASFFSVEKDADEFARKRIQYQMGEYNARLHQITGERFGYYGQPESQGKDWYPVFRAMLALGIRDADAMQIDLQMDVQAMEQLLERDRYCFEEVDTPRLVHWDLWAGNVFVTGDTITGLIDFERCIWGDPLMEVGFRRYAFDEAFRKGYGAGEWTASQKKRAMWYELYAFLVMALECDYRQYETKDMYHWSTQMLGDCMEQLAKDAF